MEAFSTTFKSLKVNSLLQYRGKRAGKSTRLQSDDRAIPVLNRRRQMITVRRDNRLDTQRICKVANHQNNITIKRMPMPPKPSTTKPTVFRLLNARSMRNKTLFIKDLVVEQDIDCLAITETWLRSDDVDVINEVCPTGHDFHHVTRGSKGGGVALLYKKRAAIQNEFIYQRQIQVL